MVSVQIWVVEGVRGTVSEMQLFLANVLNQGLTYAEIAGRLASIALIVAVFALLGYIADVVVEDGKESFHSKSVFLAALGAVPVIMLLLFWPKKVLPRKFQNGRLFFLFGFVLWLVHFSCSLYFIFTTVETLQPGAYYFQDSVRSMFENGNEKRTNEPLIFDRPQEWWDWVNGSIVTPLFPVDEYADLNPPPGSFSGFQSTSKPWLTKGQGGYLGFRQLRGPSEDCAEMHKLKYNPDPETGSTEIFTARCYGRVQTHGVNTDPLELVNTANGWNTTLEYLSGNYPLRFGRKSEGASIYGFEGGKQYPPGGYYSPVWFPPITSNATLTLDDVKANVDQQLSNMRGSNFIEPTTRLIELTTWVYNRNIASWAFVTIITEFLTSGPILVHPPVVSFGQLGDFIFPLDHFSQVNATDQPIPSREFFVDFYTFVMPFQVYYVFALCLVAWDRTISGSDVFRFIRCTSLFIGWISRLAADYYFPRVTDMQANFRQTADYWVTSRDALGVFMLFLTLTLLRFLGAWKGMDLVPSTLFMALEHIVYFLASLSIFLVAYMFCFWIMYASDVVQFSTPRLTIQALWEAMVGNIDSNDFVDFHRFGTGLVSYVTFTFITLFVVLVIVIVIIEDAFSKSREILERKEMHKNTLADITATAVNSVSPDDDPSVLEDTKAFLENTIDDPVLSALSKRSLLMMLLSQNIKMTTQLEAMQSEMRDLQTKKTAGPKADPLHSTTADDPTQADNTPTNNSPANNTPANNIPALATEKTAKRRVNVVKTTAF
eukprot:m.151541 g.151541  ORF g.151541 m.151541 type:complete len:773 (-) comp30767_c0_seq3:82-2400(-)